MGLTTSVISNGTGITRKFIYKYKDSLDWIGLSIDSGNKDIQKILGRGNGNYIQQIIDKTDIIKRAGIKLKINSVITCLNYLEDMSWLITRINPKRWKIFQVLEIRGQNNDSIKKLLINKEQFQLFVNRHKHLNPIVEDNNSMIESYVMIDPIGRFYQNVDNIYLFSRSILEVGIVNAFNEIRYNFAKFFERGGIYAW